MKTFKIQIPSPCHEDWNEMTKAEKGKFCSVCDKTVVDFSVMSTQEIQSYFLQYKDQKICGHFAISQLNKAIEKPHFLLEYKAKLEQIRLIPFRYVALFFIGLAITISGCQNRKVTGEATSPSHCSPEILGYVEVNLKKELIGDTISVNQIEDSIKTDDSFLGGEIEFHEK